MGCKAILNCVLCLLLTKTVYSYQNLSPNISTTITKHIYFLHHQGPTVNNYTKIPYKHALEFTENSVFDKNKSTIFYFHGWTETPSENEESVDTIASAFLKKKSVNLIVLDYSELVQGNNLYNYLKAVRNVTNIGQAIGYFLQKYIPQVQPLDKVHLIGHSLGCQIMSRTATAYGKGKLKWLTALDPAGPLFNIPLIDHLSKEDAQFLDVIHTDGYGYGDGRSIGHVDFFPNMGRKEQPYCKNIEDYEFCSHHMSWRYYAESILNETIYPAKKCQLGLFCTRFTFTWCCDKNATVAYMGYGVDQKSRGDYYLKMNATAPYSLGVQGYYV